MKLLHEFSNDFFKEEHKELVVSGKTKKLWAVLLDMLLAFDEVCKKYNIKYSLDSGSLLGAVRHKGFIPWDDDLDVIMLREEYDKLCRIASLEFKTPLFFQTNYTDPGSARGHAQLRRSDTTGILKGEMIDGKLGYLFNQGIFLDVLVLDSVPDEDGELADFRSRIAKDKQTVSYFKYVLYCQKIPKISLRHPRTIKCSISSKWYSFKRFYSHKDALDEAYQKLEQDVTMYNGKGMRRVANFSLNPRRRDSQIFDRGIYENLTEYDFEGYKFPGPKNFETVLRGHYGNWHEQVIGGNAHGGIVIDTGKPYTECLKK